MYIPIIEMGYKKNTASVTVFFISAFFHEYLVSVPLKTFKTWAFLGMMGQVRRNIVQYSTHETMLYYILPLIFLDTIAHLKYIYIYFRYSINARYFYLDRVKKIRGEIFNHPSYVRGKEKLRGKFFFSRTIHPLATDPTDRMININSHLPRSRNFFNRFSRYHYQ